MGKQENTPDVKITGSFNEDIGRTVIFHNDDDVLVGTLDFSGDVMNFEGKVDESAEIFIDFLKELWNV